MVKQLRRLLIFLGLVLLSRAAFAQVPLAGYIRTLGAADTYPTHLDTLQYGGYRSVLNLVSRNNTPNLHRKQGMLVYVQSEDKTYIFKGLIPADGAKDPIDNSDAAWPEYSPSSLPALSSGQILVGSASNTTAAVSLTGALSLDNTGNVTLNDGSVTTTTLSDAAVSYAKMQPIGPLSLFGNPLGTSASGSEIVLGTGLTFSGNTLNAQISSGTVTNITTGNGLTGGPITSTGTIALANGTLEGQVMVTGADLSPVLQTLKGDATLSADGTLTLANGSVSTTTLIASAVTYDKIQKIGALSLFGNPFNVNPATGSEITLGTGLTFTGNTLNATGTVESVSIADANGISGTVATPSTTPVITLSLGAISPASVAATGLVTGSNLSGTNTGDQTITLNGDITGSGTAGIDAIIKDKAVTYTKIRDIGAFSLFGNPTAASTTGSEVTLGTGLNFIGNTLNLVNGSAEKQVMVSGPAPDFLSSFQTLGGDATINADGDLIIGEDKITNNKFRKSGPQTLVGNPGSSDDHVSDITLGPGLSLSSGGVLSLSSVHSVGESYGGGIVFYVYDGGLHGLIAATDDAGGAIRWSGGTDTNTRARANAVGAGYKNTVIIIANQGAVDGNPFAATVANEFTVTTGNPAVTYADWYLPSAFELKLLADSNIPGLSLSGNYWSSTEVNANSANSISDSGTIGISVKSFSRKVRPVRAF
ncbi:MAG: hypothetical protein WBP45_14575 [Daejeonella sp.]